MIDPNHFVIGLVAVIALIWVITVFMNWGSK